MVRMQAILVLIASVLGSFAMLRYVVIMEVRLDANLYKTMYDQHRSGRKFVLFEEVVQGNRYPVPFSALYYLRGLPMFYLICEPKSDTEQGKNDPKVFLYCLRWRYSAIHEFLQSKLSGTQEGVHVQLLRSCWLDRIGTLKGEFPKPLTPPSLWEDIEEEVAEVAEGKRKKTGALLYGAPGTGKSHLIKYLATKYKMPVLIFTLNPEWDNHQILLMFSQIPSKSIVVFEDFDNYFDKRKCILGGENMNIKFSFDMILNGLDGAYTTHDGVVFFMTANNIEMVDDALKNRPSRFKFVREFPLPDLEVRKRLLPSDLLPDSEGKNLDQVLAMAEKVERDRLTSAVN